MVHRGSVPARSNVLRHRVSPTWFNLVPSVPLAPASPAARAVPSSLGAPRAGYPATSTREGAILRNVSILRGADSWLLL